MWLIDGEYFIEFTRRESSKLLITRVKIGGIGKLRRVQEIMLCPLVTTFLWRQLWSQVRVLC